MTIKKEKKELNKWQIGFTLLKSPPWQLGFSPYLRFYFLKLVSFPKGGEALRKENYRGIYWEWQFPTHRLIFTQRTYIVPTNRLTRWLWRLKIIRHQVYRISYPSGM